MSAVQAAIYDWIKYTGTLKVDPEVVESRSHKKLKVPEEGVQVSQQQMYGAPQGLQSSSSELPISQ